MTGPSAYAASGVDIEAGNRAVELMKDAVRATHGPEVLSDVGAFGGLFSTASFSGMEEAVLVGTTDGVGTKVMLSAQAAHEIEPGFLARIGHDIVNHCINDILVQGARPLFFMDYVASSRLEPELVAAVVSGMAEACRLARCALLGGETAEMPGVYESGHFDVVGSLVGVVDRKDILPRPGIQAGDLLVGMAASGPHTNGFSLLRRSFEGIPLSHIFPELGKPLAEVLLAPHRNYLPVLEPVLQHPGLKALAHITGGGFVDNLPRVLPEGLGVHIRSGSWPVPPVWGLVQARSAVETFEMFRVFNMGIGMVAFISQKWADEVKAILGKESRVIGEVVEGRGVSIV